MKSNATMTFDNHGTIFNLASGVIGSTNINNYQSANITNENTGFGFSYSRTLNNYGNFITYGGIGSFYGHINNYATGVIESHGSGTIYNAVLNNYGIINSYGNLELDWSAIYTNGTFNNHANLSLRAV